MCTKKSLSCHYERGQVGGPSSYGQPCPQLHTPNCPQKQGRNSVPCSARHAHLRHWDMRQQCHCWLGEIEEVKWKEMKQRELLVKLRVAIHQAHEENLNENGIPICFMPQNWRNLWVKKEHPPTPIQPPLKEVKEELVTPNLQYPLSISSGYTSVDPNNFDWGENLMVD